MENPGNDLADWLQEAARRDGVRSLPRTYAVNSSSPPQAGRAEPRGQHTWRPVAGFAGLTVAYLQYYFLSLMAEMYSMSTVIVFVQAGVSG